MNGDVQANGKIEVLTVQPVEIDQLLKTLGKSGSASMNRDHRDVDTGYRGQRSKRLDDAEIAASNIENGLRSELADDELERLLFPEALRTSRSKP